MELKSKRYVDTVVLSPVGRIDHSTSEDFKTALAPHMASCAEGQDRVILDFAGVEYISSVGLRVLMVAAKAGARAPGSRLSARGAAAGRCARSSPSAVSTDGPRRVPVESATALARLLARGAGGISNTPPAGRMSASGSGGRAARCRWR